VSFEDLSNDGKLLFVIFATEQAAGFHKLFSDFYGCGPPAGSYREAAIEVTQFIQDCQRTSAEEGKRRRDHQRKVQARIRA